MGAGGGRILLSPHWTAAHLYSCDLTEPPSDRKNGHTHETVPGHLTYFLLKIYPFWILWDFVNF